MKKLVSRTVTAFVAAICLIAGAFSTVAYASEEPTANVVFTDEPDVFAADPGSTVRISVPVRAYNAYISSPYISADMGEGLSMASKVTLTDRYEKIVDYINGDLINVNFDLKVENNVKDGLYKFNLKFEYVDAFGASQKITMATPVQVKVAQTKSEALLNIAGIKVDRENVKPGDSFNITGVLKNTGDLPAKDVVVTVEGYGTEGILPGYTTSSKKVGTMNKDATHKMNYPVSVSPTATAGVKTLTIKASYTDSKGNKVEETSSIYIEVKGKAADPDAKTNLIIKDIKQSPSVPTAKGKLKVTFVIENKGTADANEVKIAPVGLTNTNFSPDTEDPYIYISKLKAGAEKKITMNFTISDKIAEGLNEIGLNITYKDKEGQDVTVDANSTKLYITNVKNPEDVVVGVPKLIIKAFTTGDEDLRAGKTFNFAFDIYNTHSSLSANNIKVTLSSDENVFSVTKGSGSFYIAKIAPGDVVHQEVELKVKADCVTKSYPLKIDFEYEYEGMQKLENEISTGLKVGEVLSLPVLENSRPTVSNIIVGTWDSPRINEPCNMGFDFYNMGKSTLYNVTARLESTDFTPTQQTKFIGNVEAGNGNTYDMEVTPTIENMEGTGTLIITYEDSNGNSYDVKTELPTTFVNGAATMDPGDPGDFPPMDDIPAAKKEILPVWAFVIVQVVLFLAGILIIRKVVISLYKRKMHKKEDEEL